MKKILTVVIPSYNVEKFLDQTLKSFVEESILADIEVLIVDDGSKDKTAEIGVAYQDKYPDTFKVIRKENGGHGSTINRGIKLAVGKYFKVVDGDDWVDTKEFAKLIEQLKKYDSDYIVTNYSEVSNETGIMSKKDFHEFQYEHEYSFEEICERVQLPMHALTIKTEILQDNHIRLDEHSFYVDVEYILFPIPYVKSVAFLDLNVYMYRVALATQSSSMEGYRKHIQNHIDVTMHLIDFLNDYQSKNASPEKVRYIALRIALMIKTQSAIYSSYLFKGRSMKKEFMEFDRQIKMKNSLVYELSYLGGRLTLLRKTRFHGYFLIVLIFSLYKTISNRLCGNEN